nr:hypothetical protein [Tanacetum cinerariifolium]
MVQPPSPDHAVDIPKVEPVQPEIALATPELAPPSPDHVFKFPAENLEEEEKEEEPEEEEPEEVPDVPFIESRFLGNIHERSGSSSEAPIIYHPEDFVPATMKQEIVLVHHKV